MTGRPTKYSPQIGDFIVNLIEGGVPRVHAARAAGITYSRMIEGLKAAKVALDRKIIADLAATDAAAFGELVKVAQGALKAKAASAKA